MKYEIIGSSGYDAEVCFLCPTIQTKEIEKHYYAPFSTLGRDVMVCDIYINPYKKKTSASDIKDYMNDLVPNLIDANIKLLVVTHPDYFKVITKQANTDSTVGDIKDTIYGDDIKATYCPNYKRLFYNPAVIGEKIDLALQSAKAFLSGCKTKVGENIIKFCAYPQTDDEILYWLEKLINMQCDLSIDIEGFSLKHYDAGIGTISFCWNKHEGVAFPVDAVSHFLEEPSVPYYNINEKNWVVRKALRNFFETFTHKAIYHNVSYDVYVLIYQLFMEHILDQKGMLRGLEVMLRNWDCTQLIAYLATNSCAGNELGLKTLAQEYAGNYAVEDIHDITQIPMPKLLEYNLIDGLATWFVKEKYEPIMIADEQLEFYQTIFTPAVADIIQMQLTGMPLNMKKVIALSDKLMDIEVFLKTKMMKLPVIRDFRDILIDEYVVKKNLSYKKKVITAADVPVDLIQFNPNSAPQLQRLLYDEDFLGLPVLDLTNSKLPATGADTLEKLANHTKDQGVLVLLKLLVEYKAQAIIVSTFLPAMRKAQLGEDGWHYLFGNFRLGGTKSGRLSCVHANTLIDTVSGKVSVSKLNVGTQVLTHTGAAQNVSKVFTKGIEQMYNVTFCNGDVLTCTNDHKLLCANNTWLTLREIQDVNFKEMGHKPSQYTTSIGKLPEHGITNNGTNSNKVKCYSPQCKPCNSTQHSKTRTISSWKTKVFRKQNWLKKPNEKQNGKPTSQLHRRNPRWLWILNSVIRWKTPVFTSCKNDGTSWVSQLTQKHGRTPYRQQSIKQRNGQSSSCNKSGTSHYPLLAGEGQQTVSIQKIDIGPISTVWDITVDVDHSYLSCGVYSHNSSKPNLQNIPSAGSTAIKRLLAKWIKECFEAPPAYWKIKQSMLKKLISELKQSSKEA